MSCQSSLYLRCAKVYVDNGVSQVNTMRYEGVIYRHMVLTMPAMLRQTFYQQSKDVLSPFMQCGVRCLDAVWSRGRGTPHTYCQRYEQSTGREPLRCPHCQHDMGLWRMTPHLWCDL